LASAWENFKSVNDQRLKAIERKGYADPLLNEQLNRINNALDEYKGRLDIIETSVARPDKSYEAITNNMDASEHKTAFKNYLRKGIENNLVNIERKALSTVTGEDGGYLITSQMSDEIVRTINEISPIRKISSIETISSSSLDIIEDYNDTIAHWVGETDQRLITDNPQISKKTIAVHELYAQPKATQKLIDDANINIENWLIEKLTNIFNAKENHSFINGDGVGKPRGILSYEAGTEWGEIEQIHSKVNGEITADALFNLYFALKEQYAGRATFLMHRNTLQKIRLLKDKNTDNYLYNPGLAVGAPDSLFGIPVMQSVDMPIANSDSLAVALGDFKAGYKIVDRKGMSVMRDQLTHKPFVSFYTTKRVGGDVVNYEAIKLLRLS
jgi:HK97 family phage major capsid protein